MVQVLALITPLFGLMLIGYIAGRIAKLPLEGLAWLNFFVIYIALPAMFFKFLSQTPLSGSTGFRLVVITTFATLVIYCVSFFLALAYQYLTTGKASIGEATIQGFAGAYGNVGYMGPPLALAAFGPAAIAPAALIFSFDNALHFILAPMLMAIDDQEKNDKPLKVFKLLGAIGWKILSHPFILAPIAGMSAAAFQYTPPEPIDNILGLLAGAAAPSALFMMGVAAALRPVKKVPLEFGYLVPIKLILHPLLVFSLLTAIGGFSAIFVQTAVLLAALPAAANVYVIAEQYQQWQERASSAVVVSTITSVFSLSLVLYILKNTF